MAPQKQQSMCPEATYSAPKSGKRLPCVGKKLRPTETVSLSEASSDSSPLCIPKGVAQRGLTIKAHGL